MRRPLPGDVVLFARVLSALPRVGRAQVARGLLAQAETADDYRLNHGRCHPTYGDGSLVARLMRVGMPPLTHADDAEFLHALRIVADALLKHTTH